MALAAATISEGILGLEGRHVLRGVTLNDRSAFPRYVLDKITGLHSRSDADDVREPRRGALGEFVYPSSLRGRTVVYEGRIQALDVVSMRQAAQALRGAFALPDPISELVVSPHPSRGGVSWGYFVRPLSCDVDDEQTRSASAQPAPWQREFVASVRQADPRYFVSGVQTISGASGADVGCTNQGNAQATPQFTINGPFSVDPAMQRVTGDVRSLFLDAGPLADVTSGRQIFVDFQARTITCPQLPGRDFSGAVKFNSDWWDDQVQGLTPGAQTIRVTGGSWSMAFRHASY